MIRSVLFNLSFYISTALFVVVGSPLLLGPRKWAMAALSTHAKASLWLLKVIVGTKIEVRGVENLPEGACIAASKHQAAWETFAYIPLFKDPVTIQKAELFLIPFHGWFSKKFGMIGVKRATGPSALRHMIKEARDRVSKGREIIIFPEGTRMPVGNKPDYKSGVIKLYEDLNVPCVPMALNSGLFWRRKSQMRYPGTVIVEFLPPIEPGLPRKEFVARLQNDIETATARLIEEGYEKHPYIPRHTSNPQAETQTA